MSDIDRYITDEAVQAMGRICWHTGDLDAGERETAVDYLRGLLPGILAAHRADVLEEAQQRLLPTCARATRCRVTDKQVSP